MSVPHLGSRLLPLVHRDISASREAAQQLRRELGVTDLLTAVTSGAFSRTGQLTDGTQYQFRGVGCAMKGADISVDFDFGPEGRTDAFDGWRLHLFAGQFPEESDFHDEAIVDATLGELQRDGSITKPGWAPSPHLYYLAEPVRS